jgi:hypothetical protein
MRNFANRGDAMVKKVTEDKAIGTPGAGATGPSFTEA